MLGEIRSQTSRRQAFRIASIPNTEEFITELELNAQSSGEILELLAASGYSLHSQEHLNGPFRTKRRLRRQTRFSDGSFPVFYSSLDTSAVEAKVKHRLPRYTGSLQDP